MIAFDRNRRSTRAGNECAGKNSCKGKGVLEMSAEEWAKKGRKVVKG